MIDHGNGFQTLYAHLSQINVSLCQSVSVGMVIGYAGNTGNSFGAHLHFEIRLNGVHVNPWSYLQ
jgi:murein DD-endopeptidase MepM/ murein hydrolase activator NlpD